MSIDLCLSGLRANYGSQCAFRWLTEHFCLWPDISSLWPDISPLGLSYLLLDWHISSWPFPPWPEISLSGRISLSLAWYFSPWPDISTPGLILLSLFSQAQFHIREASNSASSFIIECDGIGLQNPFVWFGFSIAWYNDQLNADNAGFSKLTSAVYSTKLTTEWCCKRGVGLFIHDTRGMTYSDMTYRTIH